MFHDFPGFRLDERRRKLFVMPSGEPVPMTSKAIDALIHLVAHRDEVVDKDALLKAVWPRVIVEENNLERHISMLRRALGETPGENRFIATVPGRGYRFVASVVSHASVPAAPAAAKPALLGAGQLVMAAAVVISIVALAAATVLFLASGPVPDRTSAAPPSPNAVAVLPFENLTGNPQSEYIGQGIAEELIHRLSRHAGLTVLARASAFGYGGGRRDMREVGRALGAAFVIDGNVRGAGDQLQVTARLIDAATGVTVQSQAYARSFSDVFALQNELAGAILQHLSPGAQAAGTTSVEELPPTRSVEAYRLFLQANAIVGASEMNLRRALELYDGALALDADFARARAARAATRLALLRFGFATPEVVSAADRDARIALARDPRLGAAHAVMGMVATMQGRWEDSERAFIQAEALSPDLPSILNSRAIMLASVGRLDEAIRLSEKAWKLAPLALPPLMQRALMHAVVGDFGEAMRLLQLGLARGAPPDAGAGPVIEAWAALHAGHPAEAARRLAVLSRAEARAAGVEQVFAAVFAAHREPAKRPAAAARLRDLLDRVPIDAVDVRGGILLMSLFALVRDLDSAYASANHALDYYGAADSVGFPWYALWTEEMAEFRRDARFAALTRRLRMDDYWAVHGPPQACERTGEKVTCR